MSSRAGLLSVVIAVIATSARAAAPGGVAVLPVGGAAADPRNANGDVTEELRAACRATGTSVVSKKLTEQALDASVALGLTCNSETPACAVRRAGLSGADRVVLARIDDGTMFLLLVDVGTAKTIATAKVSLPKSGAARATALKLGAVRLLAPDRERGRLVLHVKQRGAAVLVDGVPRGVSPLPPLELPPGKHEVYVALAGYESHTETVDIAFDSDAALDVDLRPGDGGAPLPPLVDASPPPPSEPPTTSATGRRPLLHIAVTAVDATGVEPRAAKIVGEALLLELRKLDGTSVVGFDEVRAMLNREADRQLLGCSDASCLSEIADALGADAVVLVTASRVGEESVLGVRRLDGKTGQAQGQSTQRLTPADGEEYLAAIGPAVAAVFPDVPLRAGEVRGVPPELALRIHPPPLPVWSTVSVGGVALALAGGAAATGAAVLVAQNEYDKLASASVVKNTPGEKLVAVRDRGNALALTTNALWIGSAVAGVAAAVMLPLTDWTGAADDDDVDASSIGGAR